jgi:tetratricopeptide (TPR) repeat protein
MNVFSSHYLGVIGSGELTFRESRYDVVPDGPAYTYQKNAYKWADVIYVGGEGGTLAPTDYDMAYKRVLYCNIVLDGLQKLKQQSDTDPDRIGMVRGDALFRRALDFYNLAQLYCEVYDENRLDVAKGIVLRMSSSIAENVGRGTLRETYDRIIRDLDEAESLLPDRAEVVFRPSKASVRALLARLYLQVEKYDKALEYANLALALHDDLLDYNGVAVSTNYRFPLYGIANPEVIFTNALYGNVAVAETFTMIDRNLLALYGDNDLRKDIFFKTDQQNEVVFYGSYYGNELLFTGFATDELYLIKAETLARVGNLADATNTINHLGRHRYEKENFRSMTFVDEEELLDFIVEERRRELVLRGVRWEDLRRFNKDPKRRVTLRRELHGEIYELLPESKKWVWPLPMEAVMLGGLEQNER